MDLELPSLLVFRSVAETGSFTEAAKHWRITQPAVSTYISRLESAVGLVLLERSSSGATLTVAGIEFLKRATEVCDDYLSFVSGVETMGRRMGRRVLVAVDRSSLGERTRAALLDSPVVAGLEIEVCEADDEWWKGLEASRYDAVVAGRFLQAGLSPAIQEAVIHQERGLTVAWNPDFYPFNPDEFNFPELLRTSALVPDDKVVSGFASFLLLWCDCAYGVRPANIVRFPSEAEAATAAAAGLGVFLGPGDALRRVGEIADKLEHVRTFEFLLPQAFTFGIYCRGGEDSKEVLSAAAAISRIASAAIAE